jgi:hypothetical protein
VTSDRDACWLALLPLPVARPSGDPRLARNVPISEPLGSELVLVAPVNRPRHGRLSFTGQPPHFEEAEGLSHTVLPDTVDKARGVLDLVGSDDIALVRQEGVKRDQREPGNP